MERDQLTELHRGPLPVSDIADRILERQLVSLRGKTPRATISAQVHVDAKQANGRFERTGRGMLRLSTGGVIPRTGSYSRSSRWPWHRLPIRFQMLDPRGGANEPRWVCVHRGDCQRPSAS
jgi:hypothetical protein